MSSSTASGGLSALLRRPAVLLLLALLALASVVSLLGRLTGRQDDLKKVRLSSEAGTEVYASFSPDGTRVAYSGRAAGKSETFHIFVRPAGGGAAQQLTSEDTSDIGPVFSPDGGQIAFARAGDKLTEFLVMPAAGGATRKVGETEAATEAQLVPALSWMKDGRSLVASVRSTGQPAALTRLPLDGGAPKKLTTPPEGSDGDSTPAVSPDGTSIAFQRRATSEGGDVWVCDTSGGGVRRVTFDDHPVKGISWTADSREIVYAGTRVHGWELWRVPATGGSQRSILDAGRKAQFPAVAAKGHRLVFAESPSVAAIWRAEVVDTRKDKPIVSSQGRESAPSYSADGKKIAFRSDRSGFDEIWVADANGDNQVQVTTLKGPRLGRPRWSPDGKLLAFDGRAEGRPDIYTVPATGGKATRITASGSSNPSFSPDGKWIYNGQRQIWRITLDGGTPTQLTRHGGASAAASPDGKWIYFQRGNEIRRIPAEGGEDEEVHRTDTLFWGSLVVRKNGVYFLEFDRSERAIQVSLYDLKEKKAKRVMKFDRADMDRGSSFDISPDGMYVLYAKVDQTESNLVALEGFR